MSRVIRISLVVLSVAIATTVQPAAAQKWPPDSFTNLKVLPKDISQRELVNTMAGFTRALGVRCTYCHVGEEGQPLSTYRFPSDKKETKRKARVMLKMVRDINAKYLTQLDERLDPPVHVECATCHRGTQEPRMLQDVLIQAYHAGGLDSTLATYAALRKRYFGRFTYDFGEVPLTQAAAEVWAAGHPDDAARLYALNVEMNPTSNFAKREHAIAALTIAFSNDADSGRALYRALRKRYGSDVFTEFLMNQVGYRLLGAGQTDAAIAAFRVNVDAFPNSGNVYDSLGEAYMRAGERQAAIRNYQKSLAIDSTNVNAKRKLDELQAGR